jgi:PPOX class probable F420-dependent enzyme
MTLVAEHSRGILATIKRDGRPQLSNIAYAWDGATIRISVTADRAKTHNLRRDPRASLEVTSEDLWAYVVVEADAVLTPVAADPHDATADELVEVYREIAGDHSDWDAFRRSMVADRRLVIRMTPTHSYGMRR